MPSLAPLRPLAKRFVLPVVIVLAGLLIGLGYGLFKTPVYTANAYVLIVKDGEQDEVAVSITQAYGRIAALPETLAWSSNRPPTSPDNMGKHIRASTSPDSPMIQLAGSATRPDDAAAFANAAADALVRYGAQHREETGVRVALMSMAAKPVSPSSPNLRLSVAVGTATGVLLAGLSAAAMNGGRGRRPTEVTHRLLDETAPDRPVSIRTANTTSLEVDR
jgi:capsular polysaccharide biosynthesis protein